MGKSKGSLKGYELTNLLFFLIVVIVLGGGCWWVLYHYGTKDRVVIVEPGPGIASEEVYEDMALFYLEGFRIVENSRQYKGLLEVPATDDGLIRDMFELPGVEEITIQSQLVMVKKNGTVSWDTLRAPIRNIINNHLHSHY